MEVMDIDVGGVGDVLKAQSQQPVSHLCLKRGTMVMTISWAPRYALSTHSFEVSLALLAVSALSLCVAGSVVAVVHHSPWSTRSGRCRC